MAPTNGHFRPDNSAKSIAENHVAGINRVARLSIVIEGRSIPFFKHFKLLQYAGSHHRFEFALAHDALGGAEDQNLQSSNAFLGKRITVVQKYKDVPNSPERTFVGVVTSVGYTQEGGGLGNVVLTGYSPTILLDGAPHTQSFGGEQPVNMGIIAKEVLEQGLGTGRFDVRIDTNDFSEIPYTAQYHETHYNYLARMAEAYGEQLYYDGEVLHFGKLPPQNDPVQLIYGSNVSDIRVEINAIHTKPEFYGYNSSSNQRLTSGATPVQHKGDLAKTAYSHNGNIFKTKSLQVAPIKAQTDLDVENSQRSASGSAGVEIFTVSGNTTIPFLYPGCVCDIEMRRPDSNKTGYFTRVVVTEATHEVDTLGHYKGTFKAVASDTGFLPKPEFTVPAAQPQIATVVSNDDPQGQGRVSVRFDWQLHDTTNFIRVVMPDAGGTDQVAQNRGHVFIPETGDQVMVGFQHSHPDRPFVMGGMFHGGTALGGGSGNSVKSIMTRSGHKIIFTEDESIVITDKSGNEIHLDTVGSNINITAPETMTLNCKNMNINVSENMNTSVGQNQNNTVGMNISESAGMNKTSSIGMLNMLSVGTDFITNVVGKMTEFIQGNKESHTEKDRVRTVNGKINTQSQGTYEQHSEKEVQNNSGEKSLNH